MYKKKVIITADDLGINSHINQGIIESFQQGILTSTALLMNVPETQQGIELAKNHPDLEVGIHLSIVEGLALRGSESTITDAIKYFDNKICLIKNWKDFLKKYVLHQINFSELEEELELQIRLFLRHFTHIPFLNGTQHMHILPGVWKIVLKLARKYSVKSIRIPGFTKPSVLWINKRFPFIIPFQMLGEMARKDCRKYGIKYPAAVEGMQYSGSIDEKKLLLIMQKLQAETTEIVMHPGYESTELRENLPWAYKHFNWDWERKALQSDKVKSLIKNDKINCIRFSML
jgi:predicted glycoside hydrolase/deacetylase ChbG (UPF0249 family)